MLRLQLEQLVMNLGDTADEVVGTLQGNGIKGVRNGARFLNPVVHFAQMKLGLDDYLLDILDGKFRISLQDGSFEEVALTEAVQSFLKAFNEGAYPQMEISSEP